MKFLTSTPVLCMLFVVLWSSGFIGAKFGLGYAGTFTLLTLRYLLVTFVMIVIVSYLRAWRRLSTSEIMHHAIVGILAHAAWLASVLGAIDLGLSAGLAAFIAALQPIVTGALSASITGEKVSMRQWSGLALGLGAVLLVIGDRLVLGGVLLAYLLPFLAVAAISIASLLDRRSELGAKKATPIALVTFIHCAASLVVLTPMAFVLEGFSAQLSAGLVFSVVWLALVVSLAAYGLMFVLLRKMPASLVASLTYLSPPVTMLIAFLLFNETLSSTDILGLLIACVAVWLTIGKSEGSAKSELSDKKQNTKIVCSR